MHMHARLCGLCSVLLGDHVFFGLNEDVAICSADAGMVPQIRVNQEDRQLIISGERKRPAPKAGNGDASDSAAKEGTTRRRSERRFGKFERKFGKLPDDADLDAVSARCGRTTSEIATCSPACY